MTSRSSGEFEDPVSSSIESLTAKIPSVGYLALAVGAMAFSAVAKIARREDLAMFIGQWVPALLIIGTYNKLVKIGGSDAFSGSPNSLSA